MPSIHSGTASTSLPTAVTVVLASLLELMTDILCDSDIVHAVETAPLIPCVRACSLTQITLINTSLSIMRLINRPATNEPHLHVPLQCSLSGQPTPPPCTVPDQPFPFKQISALCLTPDHPWGSTTLPRKWPGIILARPRQRNWPTALGSAMVTSPTAII